MNLRSALSTLLILPLYVFAGITGTYEGHGVNEFNEPYTSTMFVSENGETYDVLWVYPGGYSERGTGVRKDDAFAVVFSDGGAYGIQNFEICHDRLSGPWVYFNNQASGQETQKKICSSAVLHS